MGKIKIAIAGSSGRMGRILLEKVLQSNDLVLHASLEHGSSAMLGKDAGELIGAPCGVKISADVVAALKGADVLIDFTRPEGTLHHLEACRKLGVNMVIGTTGFNAQQKTQLGAAGKDIGIVFAPNMSVGVNLCFKLLETAARVLGDDQGHLQVPFWQATRIVSDTRIRPKKTVTYEFEFLLEDPKDEPQAEASLIYRPVIRPWVKLKNWNVEDILITSSVW
jgi:hypothetical protein